MDEIPFHHVPPVPGTTATPGVYDGALALHHVGGDPDILVQLLDLFREQAPERLAKMEGAVAAGDAALLEREAHALKGTAATLGMPLLRDAAYTLERLGAGGRPGEAGPALDEVRQALEAVLNHLAGGGGR